MTLWDALRWLFRRPRRRALLASGAVAPTPLLAAPRTRGALELPPVICLPDLTERPAPKNWSAASTAALSGQFYFRDTILDQLDEYFVYAKRMQRSTPDAYALYSKIGAIIRPVSRHLEAPALGSQPLLPVELSAWFRKTLPGFGAIADSMSSRVEQIEDENKILYPRFIWFTRYERQSPHVQWTNIGTSYSCCLYWDKRSFNGVQRDHGTPQEFPVVVMPDGSVKVLRVLLNDRQVIRHKSGRHRGYASTIPHQRWGVFHDFIEWAKDHQQDPQEFLSRTFIRAANAFQESNASMIRIAARKDGVTAMFGIDPARTPYFFADRDETITEKGVKQRIFHMVRTHIRNNGSAVKMHFRGARRFRWKGYDVQIIVPIREHIDVTEVDVGVYDEHWHDELGGKAINAEHLGEGFGNALQAPVGDWAAQRAAILAMGDGL